MEEMDRPRSETQLPLQETSAGTRASPCKESPGHSSQTLSRRPWVDRGYTKQSWRGCYLRCGNGDRHPSGYRRSSAHGPFSFPQPQGCLIVAVGIFHFYH